MSETGKRLSGMEATDGRTRSEAEGPRGLPASPAVIKADAHLRVWRRRLGVMPEPSRAEFEALAQRVARLEADLAMLLVERERKAKARR